MNRLFRSPDGQAGIFFLGFGLLTVFGALQYPVGTPAQMGPGFFPLVLGMLLSLVGIAVLFQALKGEFVAMPSVDWRSAGIITGAIILAAMLLMTAGLLVAIPVLVIVASLASRTFNPLAVLGAAAFLTAMAYFIFIWGLELRIPLLWM